MGLLNLFMPAQAKANQPNVMLLKKGRTEEQKAIIDYFVSMGGCLSFLSKKALTDKKYVELLQKKLVSFDLKNRSLNKLGVREEEVNEIEPITFAGYIFGGDGLFKQGKDGKFRSSNYQVTKIYCSSNQIYVYQLDFSMINNVTKEKTYEFFFKDVTSFETETDVKESLKVENKGCLSKPSEIMELYAISKFQIVVPGDVLNCALTSSDKVIASIEGLKAKLREKKAK